MNKQARIVNSVAVDVVTGDPADFFHPAIASQFEIVQGEVEKGWRRDPATGSWSAPESEQETQVQEMAFAKISPIAFKLLFTAPERIKAKALRATDEFIEDFWGLLDDPRTTEVDLGLASVQSAVEYTLTSVKAAGVDLDVAVRKAEILSGQIA